MAYRIANSNTALTSTTGWDTVTNTPTLHASTDITITGTIYSGTYTAPNTSNYATGVAIMLRSCGYYTTGSLTITATLQQYNGSTWADTTATATITSMPTASTAYSVNTWAYFRWGIPYQFTTTSAGYYRIKITRGSSSSSPTARADSGGSNFAFMATDDRTGAIASTDDLLVIGHNYSTTPIAVTWDGTQTIGSGQGALVDITSSATLQTALYIGSYGTVTADTAASVTTTCYGNIVSAIGAVFNIGSSSTPYPSSYIFKWLFNPGTTCDYSFRSFNSTLNFYGSPKSSISLYKTTYSSGTGTAANPLIVSDSVDWNVGDEIVLFASSNNTTNYNEMEYRFIITKNSPTSYVLSNTLGGSENALTYTHTNAWVLNIERNIVFSSTNSAKGWFNGFVNAPVTGNVQSNGDINLQWVRWQHMGRTAGGLPYYGGQFNNGTLSTANLDYCVFYANLYYDWYCSGSITTKTHKGLIFCRKNTSGNYFLYMQNAANKTFEDCFYVDNYLYGGIFTYGSTNLFRRNYFNCIRRTSGNGFSGIGLGITTNTRFVDCETNCSASGLFLSSTTDTVTFENCSFGTKGYNDGFSVSGDFYASSSNGYTNVLFKNCSFGSPDLWSPVSTTNYLSLLKGSEVKIHKKNGVDNAHFWWTPYGSAQSTGSGLSDTLVRTPGSLNVRIAPESTDPGFSWTFLIPASKNTTVSFSGYFLKNVAMGTSVCTVSLYLPGNPVEDATPDASATLNDNTSATWTGSAVQSVNISSYYTGAVDGFATVEINAKSTTAGAYLYCADFFNSGDTVTLYDKLAGLSIWENAKPAPVLTALNLGGIAPAVWAVATSGLTAPGTTGKKLKDLLTIAKFIALK